MLKRQRQSTPPPPASSNTHLMPDFFGHDASEDRYSKRRRTQQPTPDGVARDYNQAANDDEDSYEEHRDGHTTNATAHEETEMTKTSEEYKSANMMLRELHILNQHRLMFSAPAPIPSMTQLPPPNPIHQLPSALPHMPTKLHPTSTQAGTLSKAYSASRHKTVVQDHFQAGPLEEAGVVSEKYEVTNKLLGSLFLSRRRVLDASSQQ